MYNANGDYDPNGKHIYGSAHSKGKGNRNAPGTLSAQTVGVLALLGMLGFGLFMFFGA